jgi:hypothetical protein
MQDARNDPIDQPILTDWQWTVRLARHGYRLGEIALIRGKTPDAILADLTIALQNEEPVPIDQLFDRRTYLSIMERKQVQGQVQDPSANPPPVLQVFAGLWPFVQAWIDRSQ